MLIVKVISSHSLTCSSAFVVSKPKPAFAPVTMATLPCAFGQEGNHWLADETISSHWQHTKPTHMLPLSVAGWIATY
jgi:hypothetical protein